MSKDLNSAVAVIGIDIRKELVPHRGPRSARCHRVAAGVSLLHQAEEYSQLSAFKAMNA